MVDEEVLSELHKHCDAGDRSNFVNEAVYEKLVLAKRKKAFELMEEFKKKHNIHMTTAQIIKAKNYGRK